MGIGILSLEFLAGSVAFLWPNVREGLGGQFAVGTAEQIAANEPEWATGLPYAFQPARVFFVNVPAAEVAGRQPGQPRVDPRPGFDVGPAVPPVDASVLALYRKCPHLGCQIPQLCDQSHWFECLCHGSQVHRPRREARRSGAARHGPLQRA